MFSILTSLIIVASGPTVFATTESNGRPAAAVCHHVLAEGPSAGMAFLMHINRPWVEQSYQQAGGVLAAIENQAHERTQEAHDKTDPLKINWREEQGLVTIGGNDRRAPPREFALASRALQTLAAERGIRIQTDDSGNPAYSITASGDAWESLMRENGGSRAHEILREMQERDLATLASLEQLKESARTIPGLNQAAIDRLYALMDEHCCTVLKDPEPIQPHRRDDDDEYVQLEPGNNGPVAHRYFMAAVEINPTLHRRKPLQWENRRPDDQRFSRREETRKLPEKLTVELAEAIQEAFPGEVTFNPVETMCWGDRCQKPPPKHVICEGETCRPTMDHSILSNGQLGFAATGTAAQFFDSLMSQQRLAFDLYHGPRRGQGTGTGAGSWLE